MCASGRRSISFSQHPCFLSPRSAGREADIFDAGTAFTISHRRGVAPRSLETQRARDRGIAHTPRVHSLPPGTVPSHGSPPQVSTKELDHRSLPRITVCAPSITGRNRSRPLGHPPPRIRCLRDSRSQLLAATARRVSVLPRPSSPTSPKRSGRRLPGHLRYPLECRRGVAGLRVRRCLSLHRIDNSTPAFPPAGPRTMSFN